MRFQIAAWIALAQLVHAGPKPIETTRPMVDLILVTNDGGKLTEFYGEVLGLKQLVSAEMKGVGQVTSFQLGTASINIVAAAKPVPQHDGGFEGGIGIRGVALFLPDADRFSKSMVSHGLPEPKFLTGKTGAKVARTTDPDGNWVELIFPGAAAPAESLNQIAIVLMVADEAKSREFYGKTLGIPETPPHGKPETGLLYAYTAGKATILVKGIKNATAHTGKVMDAAGYRSIRFSVKDVDALAAELRESGVPIPSPPHKGHGGAQAMYVADPDGNYLEFLSAPPL
jgi:catechol 2,3-dioxygenase-like lactoylglutathione lyase family enzyme